MANDSFTVSSLRAQAAALRTRADEIDAAADVVERLMPTLQIPEGVRRALAAAVVAPKPARAYGGGKGKPVGTMGMKWRKRFAKIAEIADEDPFGIGVVSDVYTEDTGDVAKPSALKRQFENFATHGYVERVSDTHYLLTNKLRRLIQALDDGADSLRNETGPPSTVFNDVLGGAETALAAQDGGPQE